MSPARRRSVVAHVQCDVGICDWRQVLACLSAAGYRGDLCLSATYAADDPLESSVCDDVAFLRRLIAAAPSSFLVQTHS